jgi:hypothetical protein
MPIPSQRRPGQTGGDPNHNNSRILRAAHDATPQPQTSRLGCALTLILSTLATITAAAYIIAKIA